MVTCKISLGIEYEVKLVTRIGIPGYKYYMVRKSLRESRDHAHTSIYDLTLMKRWHDKAHYEFANKSYILSTVRLSCTTATFSTLHTLCFHKNSKLNYLQFIFFMSTNYW